MLICSCPWAKPPSRGNGSAWSSCRCHEPGADAGGVVADDLAVWRLRRLAMNADVPLRRPASIVAHRRARPAGRVAQHLRRALRRCR
ncbi:MAG TPA: hypothetical protein DIT03_12095 [Candidatus Accumulibacter sp.]|nr:hypothetical protein [Accumulibacter sp.]HCN68978.1 hypothetical protein [Accumulibacter sp.]